MPSADRLFPEPDLQASGSFGLPPLPAEGQAAPPAPTFDTSAVQAPPAQDAALQMPQTASLGLAARRSTDDQEYLANLPTAQKIGLALQAFGAGVRGDASPIDALLARRRQQRLDTQNEVTTTLSNISKAYDVLDKVAEGPQKDALREMLGRTMPEMPGVFKAHGTDDEKAVRQFLGNATPSVQKFMTDSCSIYASSKERRACFMKLATDDSTAKKMESLAIQDSLPGAVAKVQAASKRLLADPKFKGPDGKPRFTTADVIALNEQAAKAGDPAALNPAELHAVLNRQSAFADYGLVSDKALEVEQEAKAREGAKPASAPQTRMRLVNEQEVQEEWDAKTKTWNAIGKGPRFAKQVIGVAPGGDAGGLSPDAIALLAKEAEKDKGVLANIGRGVQGAKDLRSVINKMAENLQGKTGPGLADRRAQFNADKKSLDQITPKYDAITAFENSAIQQGHVLVGLAKKVDTTGVPVVERWIRAGRKNVAGDADVSEFDAQIHLFRAEAAKILTNPNLTGVVTDTARKEVEGFLPGNATAAQVERVVKRLEGDFNIRKKTMEDQISGIKERMVQGGDAPAGAPKDGDRSTSKSGKPIVRKNGKWEYE